MSSYIQQFRGNFKSTLKWADLDLLWQTVRTGIDKQWYIYAVGEEPPEKPVGHDDLETFINSIDQLLHAEHQEDYCGIVYADNLQSPDMIKIYDPNNLGVVCGFSESPPLPGWILSTTPPVDLPSALPPPGNRRRWWQKLFGIK